VGTVMDELVQFLRARLDDDESYARNSFGDHNGAGPEWHELWSEALNIGDDEDLVMTNDSQVSRFMERHDPARVLREVEARRRIVYLAVQVPSLTGKFDLFDNSRDGWAEVLKQLAVSYSDHRDYRAEWRP
jgi:hypothetical protein